MFPSPMRAPVIVLVVVAVAALADQDCLGGREVVAGAVVVLLACGERRGNVLAAETRQGDGARERI